MNLDDLERWARGDGLEVLLIALGSVLFARLVRWAADRLVARARNAGSEADAKSGDLVASERIKQQGALAQVIAWVAVAIVYFVAGLLVFDRFNVPLTSLAAPATVVGAAIGFGAQRVVQDLLSGFFIFAERQYGYGDVVRISQPGEVVGIAGTVEEVTLRATRLRTLDGELVVIPNGEIRQVTNLSKDWARVVLDIPLAADADISTASDILRRVAEEVASDEYWSTLLLDAPSVMGVEKFAVGFIQLRFVARTLPGKQWDVARELRGRIAEEFRTAGIAAPTPVVAATGSGGA